MLVFSKALLPARKWPFHSKRSYHPLTEADRMITFSHRNLPYLHGHPLPLARAITSSLRPITVTGSRPMWEP